MWTSHCLFLAKYLINACSIVRDYSDKVVFRTHAGTTSPSSSSVTLTSWGTAPAEGFATTVRVLVELLLEFWL